MKSIFTLAAILFSIASFAAERPKPAKIAITSNDKSFMQVKIDGKLYNFNRHTFIMDNLRPGNHSITIIKTEKYGFRTRTQVIYDNSFYISPAQFINIDINRNGKVKVNKSSPDRYDRDDRYRGNDRDYNDRDYNHGNGKH